ncbi:hypothetical protein [Kutzneria kofuensis]|uniref:CU044_5270 family protein n=1 Tax=Kutzneria kofuensis TaxID=103725 RepID=A0A7W9KBX5_9PSEU|nr:hypothetical protein [Kutzneria kofuensis]MBB5889742.1 hypothetical protein [Kutzneria kofuensis]
MPDLTPFEQRLLEGLRQVEPVKRRRRWLPAAGTGAVAATLLVLTVVRPPAPTDGPLATHVQAASAPSAIRHLRWIGPHIGTTAAWTDEVWIDDVHHTVRLKSPAFDQTYTDMQPPIALDKPGMPKEFALMSPDVLVADQRTLVATLPHTPEGLTLVANQVADGAGQRPEQVLADLLTKPGLSDDMRAVAVKALLHLPDVGLLDPQSQDYTGRPGALFVANSGPMSLQLVIDSHTNTLLAMNKTTIITQ